MITVYFIFIQDNENKDDGDDDFLKPDDLAPPITQINNENKIPSKKKNVNSTYFVMCLSVVRNIYDYLKCYSWFTKNVCFNCARNILLCKHVLIKKVSLFYICMEKTIQFNIFKRLRIK